VTSGFRRDVDEISALLGCYAASNGKPLPTFRGQRIGPVFKGQVLLHRTSLPLKMRPIRCPETSVKVNHSTLRNTSEERRSQCRLILVERRCDCPNAYHENILMAGEGMGGGGEWRSRGTVTLVDGGQQSASLAGRFSPGEGTPVPTEQSQYGCFQERRKCYCPRRELRCTVSRSSSRYQLRFDNS
jgi:hypothetical protein